MNSELQTSLKSVRGLVFILENIFLVIHHSLKSSYREVAPQVSSFFATLSYLFILIYHYSFFSEQEWWSVSNSAFSGHIRDLFLRLTGMHESMHILHIAHLCSYCILFCDSGSLCEVSFLGEFLIEMSRLISDRLPELIQIDICRYAGWMWI